MEVIEWLIANWKTLTEILVIPGVAFILLYTLLTIWFERKYLAHAMLRIGPLHTGKVAGWLQVIADFIKITGKEIIVPEGVNKALFNSLPVLSVIIPATSIAFVPFGENWVIYRSDISLLLFLAVNSLITLVPIMTGWTSNNKYTIISSVRASLLYVSVEVPLILSSVAVALYARTFSLNDIVQAQSNVYFLFPQLVGAIVFFISFLAEAERVPFDILSAEQEIVAGWKTEYSGVNYALVMMSEYVSLLSWSLLFVVLYLGGYLGPVILNPTFSQMFWIILKLAVIDVILILFRSVFPRLRIDQALKLGWKYLTPLSIINLMVTAYLLTLGGVLE